MKAESIEQIREHLERGGKVKSGTLWELTCSIPTGFYLRVNGQLLFMPTDCVAPCNWELLPLEEKPTPIQRPARIKPRTDEEWAALAKQKLPSVQELQQLAKDNPPPQEWYDEEPVPLPGVPASSLPLVTEDPTGESCDNCEHCHGKGGRWDDESIDQWYWCEHCDAAKEYYAKKRCYSVSETLQPIAFRQAKNSRVQILINGNDTGAGERIRKALLFGHVPSMPDLLAWWEATTGERIEHGKRCDACGGEGTQVSELTWERADCPKCEDHPGYTVRPTWMSQGSE